MNARPGPPRASPHLKVIAKKVQHALHILDRFHIVAKLNQAIDEVRAAEARELADQGYEPLLKHSRWRLLKRVANLARKQSVRLGDLLCYSPKTVRAYLLGRAAGPWLLPVSMSPSGCRCSRR